METALDKIIKRKVVRQNLELVQAGVLGDHGQVVLQPAERQFRQESVPVKHNLLDLVY
jgi:hypothetical protein